MDIEGNGHKQNEEKLSNNKVRFEQMTQLKDRFSNESELPDILQKTFKNLDMNVENIENGNLKINRVIDGKEHISQNLQEISLQTLEARLQKFIQFVKFHQIPLCSIWKGRRQIQLNKFCDTMKGSYGYKFLNNQFYALTRLSRSKHYLQRAAMQKLGFQMNDTSDTQFYMYKNTLKKNKYTSKNNASITRLRQSRTKLLNEKQHNLTQKEDMKQSKYSKKYLSNQTGLSLIKCESFNEAKNFSNSRQFQKIQNLKKDIKESVLQNKWDFIVMAGQMNQWIEQLRNQQISKSVLSHMMSLSLHPGQQTSALLSPSLLPQPVTSFRYKVTTTNPIQIIQHHIQSKIEQMIPQIVFLKKYNTLKKKMVHEQNNKNNLKGTVLMVLEDQDKFSKNTLVNRINQRDQQLNFVLLQIMRMKSLMQWQNAVLKQAKVND